MLLNQQHLAKTNKEIIKMNRIWDRFKKLTAIDSLSYHEREICDVLKDQLEELGAKTYEDNIGERLVPYYKDNPQVTPPKELCGNLYGFVPGLIDKPPLLLSAHMDTVEPGIGKKASIDEKGVITSDGTTILGADDVAGITIILEAITRLKENNIPHRPLEILFTVSEEKNCLGSAMADYSKLRSKEGYALDMGGPIGTAANAAPTILAYKVSFYGKAAHAGADPAKGIHAIKTAANAISRIELGRPEPGVTVNIGSFSGGGATNIIPDECTFFGEIRSHSHEKVLKRWDIILEILKEEAKKTGATFEATKDIHVNSFETPIDSPVVTRFINACKKVNVEADLIPTLGGSDQNNFALNGIEGIVISCALYEAHSVEEYTKLDELEKCTELLMAVITEDN
jgi:tripeptide aminopeptidase